MLSDNYAGIDDVPLLGGVIDAKYDAYRLIDQWTYLRITNVFTVDDGNDYGQVVAALKTMEGGMSATGVPCILIQQEQPRGYWPQAVWRERFRAPGRR